MIKKLRKVFSLAVLMGLLIAPGVVPSADAALQARSQVIDPATGYPTWYQDTNNLALTNCLDQNGFCLAAFTGAALPATKALISDANFPIESFYYLADTSGVSPGGVISVVIWEAAIEAGFAAAAVDGGQAVFSRIRYRVNVTLPGTYTVTHPYGQESYVIAAADIGPAAEINFTNDVPGLIPGDFDSAVTGGGIGFGPPTVGPTFLTNAAGTFITDPTTGNRYLGLPGAPVAVVGGIGGVNSVTITGPTLDTFVSSAFGLQGKVIGMDVQPANINHGGVGMVTVHAAPELHTVTVTNTTGGPITFGAIAPAQTAGTDFADFVVTPPAALGAVNCAGATVAAAGTCSFDITFTPVVAPKAARAATLLLAPTAVAPATDPPTVTLNLAGTALVDVVATKVGNGAITSPGVAGAGTNVTFTVTPDNLKFKVKEVADGATILAPLATDPTSFTINTGTVDHAVTAAFMPSGDLDANGKLETADALKALKIVAGIQAAVGDDNAAADAAPLDASNKPASDGKVGIGDVLVILRRVIGLETW
jgi:hypothetical protein